MNANGAKGSVRLRLTLWYAGAMALALLLYAGSTLGFLWSRLRRDLDRRLEQDIAVAAATLEEADGKLGWDRDEDADHLKMERPWVEVRDEAGKVLFRSPELERGLKKEANVAWMTREAKVEDHEVQIRAARSMQPLIREMRTLGLGLALGLPLAVGLAGMIGYLLARRALAPIGRMAESAKAITAERLDARLEIADPGDELGQLALVFNATLERLEKSFEQLRRFTGDASHEMRTPLTALRSVGEVGLRMERSPGAYREIVGSMLEESDRLARLVESLLTLSRADGGQVKLHREPADLAGLAGEASRQLEALAEEKGQKIEIAVEGDCGAEIDALVLRQAIINILDNAIKYSPAGGKIAVKIQGSAERIEIAVADEGPGIPEGERMRIFERFYRIDLARSRDQGGTGLGLAIAKWGVEAHGGKIEAAAGEPAGSVFRIWIPKQV